jgi:hypothetical protein
MVIDTGKSASDYAGAIKHLLPPGEYWQGQAADDITAVMGDELARIHAKIDTDFNISTGDSVIGWTISDYEQMLTDFGLTGFKVYANPRTGGNAGQSCGTHLGSVDNLGLICINYQYSQKDLFIQSIPKLKAHKLTTTRILAWHSKMNICGFNNCGENNSILII